MKAFSLLHVIVIQLILSSVARSTARVDPGKFRQCTDILAQIEPLIKVADLQDMQQMQVIVDKINEAIEFYDLCAPAYRIRGQLYLEMGHQRRMFLEQAVSDLYKWLSFESLGLDTRDIALTSSIYAGMGNALTILGRGEEAIEMLDLSLQLNPAVITPNLLQAKVLIQLNQHARALSYAEAAVKLDPGNGHSWNILSAIRNCTVDEIESLKDHVFQEDIEPWHRAQMAFVLGNEYHHRKLYEQAWTYYSYGNSILFPLASFDIQATEMMYERIKSTFSAEYVSRRARESKNKEAPIFIVGPARSGSTLIETILSAHEDVLAGGENTAWFPWLQAAVKHFKPHANGLEFPEIFPLLDISSISSIGDRYSERMKEIFLQQGLLSEESLDSNEGNVRWTDKMLDNFRYISIILDAMPAARVITCHRHVLDIATSVYTSIFQSLDSVDYGYDLATLGKFLAKSYDLMKHFEDLYPDRVMAVRYEHMIVHHEAQVRRLLDFVGLKWDPSVLKFYNTDQKIDTASLDQVRKPIYRSKLNRWKKYLPFFEPIIEPLSAYLTQAEIGDIRQAAAEWRRKQNQNGGYDPKRRPPPVNPVLSYRKLGKPQVQDNSHTQEHIDEVQPLTHSEL